MIFVPKPVGQMGGAWAGYGYGRYGGAGSIFFFRRVYVLLRYEIPCEISRAAVLMTEPRSRDRNTVNAVIAFVFSFRRHRVPIIKLHTPTHNNDKGCVAPRLNIYIYI